MTETIASAVERFIEHKRALGRKYHSEARELGCWSASPPTHQVSCLEQLTPALLDDFLASRPRPRPRSFNHLLGVVGCLLDWAVSQQLLDASAAASPPPAGAPRTRSRSCSTLPRPAACSTPPARCADNPRAPQRGPTYRAIFALCYGLGLRAGEACGLRLGDVDTGR